MQWFKNLHAMPKLLLSFGTLLAFSGIIGFQAMLHLEESNARFDELYQKHLIGLNATASLRKSKMACERYVRNAIIDIEDQGRITQSEQSFDGCLSDLNTSIAAAGKLMVTQEGQAQLELIGSLVPQWAQRNREIFTLVKQGNAYAAMGSLRANEEVSSRIDAAAQRIVDLKLQVGEKNWQEVHKAYQQTRISMIALLAGAVLIGIFMALWIGRQFSRPLAQTVKVLRRVAAGDLTCQLEVESKEEVGQMAAALNQALEHIRLLLEEVTVGSTNVSAASQQLASTSQNFAAGSQEQAASLEETSASLEEITAAVRQNADNAREANQLAANARDAAEQGGAVVSTAVAAMSEINSASAKISDIITTIDEIAFQTNLLAVNAAVEAARAGEQGRGFAVVSSEVRSLAQRSAGAAREIKLLIQDSLRKVERGSDLVNRSGETLQGIVTSVKHVTDIVGEIAAASAEQSAGIDQVSTAMTQMDRVTQSNSTQTEELSSTAHALSEQSARLLSLVQKFTISHNANSHHSNSHNSKISQQLRASLINSSQQQSKPPSSTVQQRASSSPVKAGVRASNGNGMKRGDHSLSATAILEATDEDFEQF